jgi:hypothetical protein
MINVLFLFPKSADLTAVDDFIANRFVPNLKQISGLRSVNLSVGELMSAGGPPPYARVVEASFDALEPMMAHVQSPQAQAERETMKELGALILFYEVSEVV